MPIALPGASGAIAAHAASEAVPDSYTLFAPASSLFVTLPGKAKNLPLVLPRDFLPVGSLIEISFFLCASTASGIKTLPELIARAKAKPGQIGFAASGIGRLSHLRDLLLEDRAGIEFRSCPTPAALIDVIVGRVPVIAEGYASLAGAIRAHTLSLLAVGSTHRLSDFPDLPSSRIDYIASPEGQRIIADAGELPVRPDVRPRDPSLIPDGETFKGSFLTPEELDKGLVRWTKIFDEYFR